MKKKKLSGIIACLLILFGGCKEKDKKVEKNTFISAAAIINDQVNHVDSSMYSIIKVTYKDSINRDTEYIRREDFRFFAKEFLELPELSQKQYKEENIPGPISNLSTISYTPINPDKNEIQRVDFIIDPDLAESGKSVIKSIFIDKSFTNKDSSVQKRMLWQVDKSFQVTTTRQLVGQAETETTYKVIWDEDEEQ